MKKIGRNDPCPCNSGRKYKHCCFARDRELADVARAGRTAVGEGLARAAQLQRAGDLPGAEALCQQMLQIDAENAEAHMLRALVLHQQGRLEEAAQGYQRAIALQPDWSEACCNLGSALKDLGRPEEAIALYRRVLSRRPKDVLVHFNLGNALKERGSLEEAIDCYRKALSLDPRAGDVYINLGVALVEQGKADEAVACYRKALAIDPGLEDAHANLGVALAGLGRADEALASYRAALSIRPDDATAYSNQLFLVAYQSLLPPGEQLALARGWERAVVPAAEREAARGRRFQRTAPLDRRLRVGYVSGDFRQHAVSYFLEPLLACHDRARIEIFAYSASGHRDAITARFEALAENWIPAARLPDAALRERIEADGIDVLIDLSGHTSNNRLGVFARRAAPVQAHYLGYFATTGLSEMDYWIGDEVVTPAANDAHFSERIWRLPRAWLAYRTVADAPAPDWRPAADGAVWFGSFNNLGKLNPQTLALWAQLLRALPEGRLRLKAKELADAGNRQRILDTMAKHGISPDRIDLQAASDWSSYMAQYNGLDVALDPVVSHGGGTTTCDALWMGVPVIHAQGSQAGARFTASILGSVGHPEWIAASEAEYVEKALALARDASLRRRIRFELRKQMASSPLCDLSGLARSLEDAYLDMFGRWQQSQAG